MARLDLLLYLVTDPSLAGDRGLLSVVAAALAGGATAVQLRDKRATPRELIGTGLELRKLMRGSGAAFLVNDRVDVARLVEADGAHVGAEDLPPMEARRLLPGPLLLGVSAGSLEEAREAQEAGADYVGVGPVFDTATKADAGEPVGLSRLAEIAASISIPVVGIGGIDAGNAASVIEAGAAGVAVISAVMGAPDPESAAREIRHRVEDALDRRDTVRRTRNP